MIMYQRENSLMSCACAVYTILIYALVTHFYCTLAEGVQIHNIKYFDSEELVTIYKISLQRCVCECKAKKSRCLSVNYKRAFPSCRLNVNKPNTEEELLDKPGSVYIEMDDDDISGCDNYKIASNTDKSVVPFNQPACGKPAQKANAIIMGNVYSNGSRIKYVCSERFKQLDQTESISVCLHNESWSHINFTCKPDTIGKTCSSNQECVEQLSECRDGLCFCLRNHIYSLTEYACVPRFLGHGSYIISGPDVIPNENFVASSSHSEPVDSHKPWLARLDSKDIYSDFMTVRFCGCWAAKDLNKEQYIQVDMTNSQSITAVTTKGRDPKTYIQFVKSYKVLYSVDGVSFYPVLDHNGKDMIFPGNTLEETNSTVTNDLPCPIQARYIRINPQEWHNHISLRFDVIGSTIHSADCDFENGTCGWQNEAGSVVQWHIGKPNNTEGGPANDHTYNGGKRSTDPVTGSYMYITANQQEHVSAKMSMSIQESNVSRCLSLWYTASKNYSGSLNVITAKCDIGIEKLKNTTNTNFAETWNLSTVRVESGVNKIVIEGVWTSATRGVLAIDDVKLNETDCS